MKRKIYLILFIIFFISFSAGAAHPYEEARSVFSSKFCTIFYDNYVDLKKVDRCVNLSFSDFYVPRAYKADPGLSIEGMIADKFDAIFSKVEEMLDMYPARIHAAVNIYKSQEDLDKVYEEFFNEPNKAVSFYIYKTNTIYTVESQLNENILAHEMAHCIIDHYFVILPPKKIQEMLSAYVDLHLED
jgi:hypothetical protein